MKTYEASRLADGNKLFPPKVIVERTGLRVIKPGVFKGKEVLIKYSEISNISLNTPLVGFSTITFRAGYETYKLHGFAKKDVKDIERYIRLGQTDMESLLEEINENGSSSNTYADDYTQKPKETKRERTWQYDEEEIEEARKALDEELESDKNYLEEELQSDKDYLDEDLQSDKDYLDEELEELEDESEREEKRREYERERLEKITSYEEEKAMKIRSYEEDRALKIKSFEEEYGVKYVLEDSASMFQTQTEVDAEDTTQNAIQQSCSEPEMEEIPQTVTPPPPPAFSFYAMIENKQQGPYNWIQFKRLVDNDLVSKNTYVWCEGMSQWQYAKDVPEMAEFFPEVNTPPATPAGPPPLPNS